MGNLYVLYPDVSGAVGAGADDGVPFMVSLTPGKETSVWPVLAGVEGDMPVQRLMCNGIAHGGAHSCYRCALTGQWCPDAKSMRCVNRRSGCDHVPADPRLVCVLLTWSPARHPTTCRVYSFLSYSKPITQHVPARMDGTSQHAQVLESGYSVPHGLLDGQADPPVPRTRWTESAITLRPQTWWTTCELKYTARELLLRGRTADAIASQAGHTKSAASTSAPLKRLGLRGSSMFSSLSYFKYALCLLTLPVAREPGMVGGMATSDTPGACHSQVLCSPLHFFRLGTAHILLLGLLKDFWAQFVPKPADLKLRTGAAAKMVLPRHIRKAISRRARMVQATSAFTKPYEDIIRFVHLLTLPPAIRALPRHPDEHPGGHCSRRCMHPCASAQGFEVCLLVHAQAAFRVANYKDHHCLQEAPVIPHGEMAGFHRGVLAAGAVKAALE